MPDITMCQATKCSKKSTCKRHSSSGTKPTPDYQSFSNFFELPEYTDELGCEYYWEIKQK